MFTGQEIILCEKTMPAAVPTRINGLIMASFAFTPKLGICGGFFRLFQGLVTAGDYVDSTGYARFCAD